jgi:hypothetical protein
MKLTHVSAATDKHRLILRSGTVGDGDLYSVRPGVIKGGHVIDLIESVGREFRSSVVELSVQLWNVNQR